MPGIKEKPKIGQPKEKRQRPGPPRQAGRLMREKFAQGLEQRKELEAEDSAYAVDQVEQAGQRGADEFVRSFQQDRRGCRNGKPNVRKDEKDTFSGSPENSGTEGETPPSGRTANTPKERRSADGCVGNAEDSGVHGQAGREAVPVRERPRLAIKEREKEALTREIPQGQGPAPVSASPRRPSAGEGRRPRPEKNTGKRDTQLARKLKTGSASVKKRVAAPLGGKEPLLPKVRSAAVKPTAKQPVQAAKQQAQRRMVQQTATQVKRAAKGAADFARRLTVAVVRAAAAVVGSLVGLVGGGVLLIVLLVVALIAAILNSPFGIFFAEEPSDPETVSVSQAVAAVNIDYNAQLERLQAGGYDDIVIHGQGPDWGEVLAVFAVHTAGKDDGVDVVTLDQDRVDRLKGVFWDMTDLSSEVETIDHPGEDGGEGWTEYILHIIITPKTADDMRTIYAFTQEQNSALDELLSDRAALAALAGSLNITDAEARELLQALPADLEQARKDTVETALSLVGKVSYFWGGKSLVIGWDSRWGQLTKVWAAGSSTTGTYRPYGLDCSGFMDWIFYNITDGKYILGRGGGATAQHSYCTPVSQTEAQPGDLAFYPDDSHVGIVVGRREDGKLLVCHCSSGQNNVVVTEFTPSGFTPLGRPDLFWS